MSKAIPKNWSQAITDEIAFRRKKQDSNVIQLPQELTERRPRRSPVKKEDLPEVLTIDEVASILRRNGTKGVYELIRLKKIKGFKDGNQWKVLVPDLMEYIRSCIKGA